MTDSTEKAANTVRKVVNPYARKKKKNPTPSVVRAAPEHPAASFPAASFSQAFESMEESQHYQNEVAGWKKKADNGIMDSAKMEERAQQREFDAMAACENAEQQSNSEKTMSARDHHVMLQPHVLHVSTRQRGNGVLKFIRNVPFDYSNMVPDYIMSSTCCALFLSLKYHKIYPRYIENRIAELKKDFALRVLLVLVDVEDNAKTLLELNHLAVLSDMTLILAWSEEEAARYLETYKAYDGKDASSIQRREQTNFVDQVADVLSSVRSVNKTDSGQLLEEYSCLKSMMAASLDELATVHGMGEKKVRRLHDAFHKPFSSRTAKKRKEDRHADTSKEEVEDGLAAAKDGSGSTDGQCTVNDVKVHKEK